MRSLHLQLPLEHASLARWSGGMSIRRCHASRSRSYIRSQKSDVRVFDVVYLCLGQMGHNVTAVSAWALERL